MRVAGLEKRQFLITTDGIAHVFRNSMRGISPLSTIGDVFLGAIAPVCRRRPPPSPRIRLTFSALQLVLPIWRRHMDREVLEFGEEHRKQVVDKL